MCVHACMRCVQLYYSCRDSAVQLCSYGRTFDTCSSSSSCEGRCGCRLGALHCVVGWAHAAGSHCLACCERAPRALQPAPACHKRSFERSARSPQPRIRATRGAPPPPARRARLPLPAAPPPGNGRGAAGGVAGKERLSGATAREPLPHTHPLSLLCLWGWQVDCGHTTTSPRSLCHTKPKKPRATPG
jgi:hypothetical protein